MVIVFAIVILALYIRMKRKRKLGILRLALPDTLQAGVIIGEGAVVMSRPEVTHDVSPYAVVGDVPARIITQRGLMKPLLIH